MESLRIGDYIEYKYCSTIIYGCIVSENKNFFDVIKQSGGAIWSCVTPIKKITEEEFLSKFYILEERQSALLQKLDILPVNLQTTITNAIEKKKLAVIDAMELYQFYD